MDNDKKEQRVVEMFCPQCQTYGMLGILAKPGPGTYLVSCPECQKTNLVKM